MENITIIEVPKTEFSFETAIGLVGRRIEKIVNKKVVDVLDTTDIINYLNKYFYQTKNGCFYYFDVETDDFILYDKNTIDDVFFKKFNSTDKNIRTKMTDDNFIMYNTTYDLNKPRIYKEGIKYYINFNQFYHLQKRVLQYNTFDTKTIEDTKIFLDYIKMIVCGGYEDQYIYMLKWISNMLRGNHNDSIIYMKGPEGIGKSTLGRFLMKLMGNKISVECGKEPLINNFNSLLKHKHFILFEELTTVSESEWGIVSARLKILATSPTITINAKYVQEEVVLNVGNYMICSNHEAIKESNGRRWFILDISTEKREDHEYFGMIDKRCFRDDVYLCFLSYLLFNINVNEFNAQRDMPETRNKQEARELLMKPSYKFIRDEYVLKHKDINKKRTELYEEYVCYVSMNNLKKSTNINFYKDMRELNIKEVKNGVEYFKSSIQELITRSKQLKWDLLINKEEEQKDVIEEINYMELCRIQKKEIEELKKQLELLTQNKQTIQNNNCIDITDELLKF